MATIGQALTTPESGWQRIDDTNELRISYEGGSWSTTTTGHYASTTHYTSNISPYVIKFSFFGTKLRIIGSLGTNRSTSISVIIDGVEQTFSEYSTGTVNMALAYEVTGLASQAHNVVLKNNNAGTYFYFDAIDIDDTGKILHNVLPQKLQVSDIVNMSIGDCVACRYTVSSSGVIGTFSEFTSCNAAPISYSSAPATCDGLFYFIFVGYDSRGRMKFLADRNIQNSISWNTINTAGYGCTEGLEVDLGMGVFYRTSIRMVTGGYAAGDLTNEWYKIVGENTLGNKITAGSDAIWHFSNNYTWTLTTYTSTSANRTTRGNSATISNYGNYESLITSAMTFRPMLIIESLNPPPVLNSPLKTVVNPQQIQISATSVEDLLGEAVRYKIEVIKPDNSVVLKKDYDAELQTSPYAFQTLTFAASEFAYGANKIRVTMKDQNGFWSTWDTTVTKSLTKKTLIQDGTKWLYIDGSNLSAALADYTSATATDKENAFLNNGMGLNLAPTNAMLSQITSDTFNLVFYKRITLT